MTKFSRTILLSGLVFLFMTPTLSWPATTTSSDSDKIVGRWLTADKTAHVTIVCTEKGRYEGSLTWLEEPNDPETGKPYRDTENPDHKLRGRPLLGVTMLHDFTYDAEERVWDSGTIYDPDVGKTYKCVIKLMPVDDRDAVYALDVRGYIGFPALGRSEIWTRVVLDETRTQR